MKKMLVYFLAAAMALALIACGDGGNSGQTGQDAPDGPEDQVFAVGDTIALTVWGSEEEQELLAALVEEFQNAYSEYTFDIQTGVESEATVVDAILAGAEAAADVYTFSASQLAGLLAAGALLPIDSHMDAALQNFAGKSVADISSANSAGSIAAATSSGSLCAFPFSEDGYFLFYDPSVISDGQAQTWDGLLEAAGAAGKKVGMPLASGPYAAGFFCGAGFTASPSGDGGASWNGTSSQGVTGVQVVQSMLDIAAHPAFLAVADGGISSQLASGSLCAAIAGCGDLDGIQESADWTACKLPTFTCNGAQIQMGSVASYRLMGVNPNAENVGWAVMLAEFLTNEESQLARYEASGLAPCNRSAASALAAEGNRGFDGLMEQSAYAVVQDAGGKYWESAASFGEQIARGDIGSDSIQAALDELAADAAG